MVKLNRRTLLAAAAGALEAPPLTAASAAPPFAFGVVLYSYGMWTAKDRSLAEPLSFLRFCRERGAGGVQVGIPPGDAAHQAEIRRFLERSGMWLEGIIQLPRDRADADRFGAELGAAADAGARVVRTTLIGSRRYEAFGSGHAFRQARAQSLEALRLAEPLAARSRIHLALENHKDLRTEELLAVLRDASSEWVGACVDTGNSLALLEEPLETVQALAPFAFACHLKDMAVDEAPEGFRLAEVPLGGGFLEIPRIVRLLRQARPDLHFSIEMITRDPLTVPCLTERYWSTLDEVPGSRLARILSLVRRHSEGRPLPRPTTLDPAARLKLEDDNLRACLRYAAKLPLIPQK